MVHGVPVLNWYCNEDIMTYYLHQRTQQKFNEGSVVHLPHVTLFSLSTVTQILSLTGSDVISNICLIILRDY